MEEKEKAAAADTSRKDAEDRAKADAEHGEKLDKLLKGIDAVCERLDSHEKRMDSFEDFKKEEKKVDKRKDADEKAEKPKDDEEESETEKEEGKAKDLIADKAKKDADEKEEEKKADSVNIDAIRREMAKLAARIPMQSSDNDYAAMADAQARADGVYQAFGDSASRPLQGEDVIGYRLRMITPLQKHSPVWKSSDLAKIARVDSATFKVAEDAIYADAAAAARNPASAEDGSLRQITRTMPSGHKETTFVGRPAAWMARFGGNRRSVERINTPQKGSLN
jgi:hypothetical protein